MEKSLERIAVINRMEEYEKQGLFDADVENDPPTRELLPSDVDYLNKKISSKIKTFFANKLASKFYEKMIKNNQLIIEDVKGIENYLAVTGPAMITCNHFNMTDNYAIYKAIEPYLNGRKLYKIIREGNYTVSPKPFGFFFRNCNTLPLSSNVETMKLFLKATSELLSKGNKILIYPEQAMWWNYRKPRPFKNGAFKIASTNNVPVIPMFITMKDSDILDSDGFYVQKYIVNIMPAIYPKKDLNKTENMKYLKEENFSSWKKCYEDFYQTKLEY